MSTKTPSWYFWAGYIMHYIGWVGEAVVSHINRRAVPLSPKAKLTDENTPAWYIHQMEDCGYIAVYGLVIFTGIITLKAVLGALT